MKVETMNHCDLTTGECGPMTGAEQETITLKLDQRVNVLYATDPICSHCWAMEPGWRKLLFHYGDHMDARHVYGGLLPGWNGFEDAGAGIRNPADVAPHWDEVAEYYGQPLTGDVWRHDPLSSSYPPSVAVHTVRLMAPVQEENYLRRIRQALFLEARNIARTDVLVACAEDIGLDTAQFAALYGANVGQAGFERDMRDMRQLPVRGFPTVIFADQDGNARVVRGTQTFEALERALLSVVTIAKSERQPTVDEALAAYGSGTTREFAELLNLSLEDTEAALTVAGARREDRAGSALWHAPVAVMAE